MKLINFIISVIFILGVAGCATMYNPATQQEEFIIIGTSEEVSLGARVAGEVERRYKLSRDPEYLVRVEEIGEEIARVCERKDLQYHFKAVEHKEINAFATPGGYVYVHTGLLDIVNDDELACVIAHEVGHIAARHSIKRLQADMGYNILMSLILSQGKIQDFEQVFGITFDLITLGYSREDELMADKLALRYAYKAGYEPEAMISFLKKLEEIEGREHHSAATILRSHPQLSHRIKQVNREIAALKGEAAIEPPKPLPAQPKPKPAPPQKPKSEAPAQPRKSKTGAKFCPACGRDYPARYKYCPKDGRELL